MSRLPLRCLPVILLLPLAAAAWGQFSDAADKVRDAVVTVTADKSVGAGFIVNADGYAITNHHVVDKAESVTVKLRNGDEVPAEVVEPETERDLCLLKLDRKHLPAVQFASSGKLKQGDEVAAVGAPFGLPNSLTTGTVSSTEREIDGQKFIQIDAALNKGNSGGPVINKAGLVVGVATKAVKGGQDLGFAIPSDEVMAFLVQKAVSFEAALGEAPPSAAAATGEDEAPTPPDSTAPPLPQPPPAPEPSPLARPWAVLATAAVIAFIVALVTALVVARQKAVVPLAQPPAVPPYGYPPPPQGVPPAAAPRPAAPPQQQPEDLSDIDIQLR